MEEIKDEVVLGAPLDRVWQAILDPREHASWHPMITNIAGEHALGRIRRCDVLVGKKPGRTEERCVSYDEPHRIIWSIELDTSGFSRMVSEWRAGFTIAEENPGTTRVIAESVFEPKGWVVRVARPVIRRKFHQAHQTILRGLQEHVEH